MDFEYIILIFALPAWYLALLTHELAHVVAAWAIDIRVLGFYPYPHKYVGRFYWGRVQVESTVLNTCERVAFSGAPAMKQIVLMVLWSLAGVGLGAYVLPFIFCELVDAFFWWKNYIIRKQGTDGQKVRDVLFPKESYNG